MNENFYSPPRAELLEPTHGDAPALAGRGTRLAATVVDTLAYAVAFGFVGVGLLGPDSDRNPPGVGLPFLWIAVVMVANAYFVARDGQTIGKRALGIRVVRSDGSMVSLERYVGLRFLPIFLLSRVPLLGLIVSLADVLAIFRDSRRCLHDELADTIVIVAP